MQSAKVRSDGIPKGDAVAQRQFIHSILGIAA
jgi:hypothetical protein